MTPNPSPMVSHPNEAPQMLETSNIIRNDDLRSIDALYDRNTGEIRNLSLFERDPIFETKVLQCILLLLLTLMSFSRVMYLDYLIIFSFLLSYYERKMTMKLFFLVLVAQVMTIAFDIAWLYTYQEVPSSYHSRSPPMTTASSTSRPRVFTSLSSSFPTSVCSSSSSSPYATSTT